MKPIIEIERLTKRFGRNVALENVSYEVAPGTVFALLGENGVGKTTTIKILLGLEIPDDGRASVLGLDPMKDDLKIRSRIGYVPEMPSLYDWMSVEEIGRFTAAFHPEGFWNEYSRLIESHKLPMRAKIKDLSKGMRAKVGLSLALGHDPELLILDEPTSGLDALVRREFLESMVERAAAGKTVFLSSHQIAEVERVADTVAIMKKSNLLIVEPLDALKADCHRILASMKDENAEFSAPVGELIEQRSHGREIRVIGRKLDPAATEILSGDPNITRFEIQTPSLEEIFMAYMSGTE